MTKRSSSGAGGRKAQAGASPQAPPAEPPHGAGAADTGGASTGESPESQPTAELMVANIAKAAAIAQEALLRAAGGAAGQMAGLGPDPFGAGAALTRIGQDLAAHPDRLASAQLDLLGRHQELWLRAAAALGAPAGEARGGSQAPGGRPDKRFSDPLWDALPVFSLLRQSYLATSTWLNDLVGAAVGLSEEERRSAAFAVKQLTDAMSPANFLLTNPVALRTAWETQGESLVRGMENLAGDIARGGGRLAISQTDFSKFEIGVNIATTPGKVVFQNEILQLIHYAPAGEQAYEIPLLIFPPWINKFYILDLRAENSMIRWLTGRGFTVFVVSWVNPDAQLANKTFEDYLVEGVYAATAAVLTQTGAQRLNAVGYCIGGTLLSCALAHMAALGDPRIASATFFAAQQDFSEPGDLALFTRPEWIARLEAEMKAHGGILPGQVMADTFNALRANDLIWSYHVSNYLLGQSPRPFDLLYWNDDQTRMPQALHLFYLRRFYGENALARGQLELGGVRLDLAQVHVPVYVQSSREDHISPARSVYRGARLFGGEVTFTLAGSGHIAGVINPPTLGKYQHWTNPKLPDALEDWMLGASEQPGSWWPHWGDWLAARSGALSPALDPASGPLPVIEDAPGAYVKVRS